MSTANNYENTIPQNIRNAYYSMKLVNATSTQVILLGTTRILEMLQQDEVVGVEELLKLKAVPDLIRILKFNSNQIVRRAVSQILRMITKIHQNEQFSSENIISILSVLLIGNIQVSFAQSPQRQPRNQTEYEIQQYISNAQAFDHEALVHLMTAFGNMLRVVSSRVRNRMIRNGTITVLSQIMRLKMRVEGMLQGVILVLSELCLYQNMEFFYEMKGIISSVLDRYLFAQVDIVVLINLCRCIQNSIHFAGKEDAANILTQLVTQQTARRLINMLGCSNHQIRYLSCSIITAATLLTYDIIGSVLTDLELFQNFKAALQSSLLPKLKFAISYIIRQVIKQEPEKTHLIINAKIIDELVHIYYNVSSANQNLIISEKTRDTNKRTMTEIILVVTSAVQHSQRHEIELLKECGCVVILNSRLQNNDTIEVRSILQALEKILVCGLSYTEDINLPDNKYYSYFKRLNVQTTLEVISLQHPEHDIALYASTIIDKFLAPNIQNPDNEIQVEIEDPEHLLRLPSCDLDRTFNLMFPELQQQGNEFLIQTRSCNEVGGSHEEDQNTRKININPKENTDKNQQKYDVPQQDNNTTKNITEGITKINTRYQQRLKQKHDNIGQITQTNTKFQIQQKQKEDQNKKNNSYSSCSSNTRSQKKQQKLKQEKYSNKKAKKNNPCEQDFGWFQVKSFDEIIHDYINDAENNAICNSVINNIIDNIDGDDQKTIMDDIINNNDDIENQFIIDFERGISDNNKNNINNYCCGNNNNNDSNYNNNGSSIGSSPYNFARDGYVYQQYDYDDQLDYLCSIIKEECDIYEDDDNSDESYDDIEQLFVGQASSKPRHDKLQSFDEDLAILFS
eukprot:TRINITY_DN7912_c0_g1_i2.p1 TRINITY_DN7912_c0_g1~~TRINITY_DN7912_c0_g1_i2.p1  ORF type:complete len:932 (+),score=71.75 TRINITY_DN7912_c0_g1_i2:240-2798(+)